MSEVDSLQEAAFARIGRWLDEVAHGCVSLKFDGAGVEECVELIGKLKSVSVAMDGLKVALMGHVSDVQAAQARAREAREARDENAGSGDTGADRSGSAGANDRPGLLPGRDATMFDVMARTGMQSRRAAGNEVRAAQVANGSFPGFVKLMRQGRISQDYVDILCGAASRPELVERSREDEKLLMGWALGQDVDEFRKSMRAWTFQHAPKMAERKAAAAERREKFRVYADGEGYKVHGWLTAMSGVALNSVIRAQAGVPAKTDRRQQDERNAEAFMQIVYGIRGGAEGTGVAGGGHGSPIGASPVGAGVASSARAGGSGRVGAGAGAGSQRPGGLRHQVLVHVPLSTLVRTEEAIEKGCGAIGHDFGIVEVTSGTAGSRRTRFGAANSGIALSGPDWPDTAGSGGTRSGPAASGPARSGPFGADPAGALDCPVTGTGLGRQGACTESRAEVERDLGAVLGMIRAGIDVAMLDGFAPARLSDGSPVAPTQLAQLLCDSDLARVVLTAHGEPIDVSRNQRLFSMRQTRSVMARDRHCRFPGCSRGLEVGQVHHAQEWEKGGATVIDNAVMLCFAHHRYVHQRQITISHHAGGFVFTELDGTLVGVTHHAGLLAA